MIVKIISSKGINGFGYSARYSLGAIGGTDPLTWKRTADYVLETKTEIDGIDERVGVSRITNCVSDDPAYATIEIQATQKLNTRVKTEKHLHLVVSFPAGEVPNTKTIHKIEDRLMSSIGLAEHQRISVVHHDTDHLHLHIVASKIHPKTYNVCQLSFAKNKLMHEAATLEIEYALQRTNHGLGSNDELTPPGDPAIVAEEKSALVAWSRDNLITPVETVIYNKASTWADLHNVLAEQGVTIETRGAGLILIAAHPDGSIAEIKPSSVSRDFSKAKFEKQLGDYVPAAVIEQTKTSEVPHQSAELSTESNWSPEELSAVIKDFEIHTGQQSVVSWLQETVAAKVATVLDRESPTWENIHNELAGQGVELVKRGAGLVFMAKLDDKDIAVKASAVSRDFSKKRLEVQLGDYVPAASRKNIAIAAYVRAPKLAHQEKSSLWDSYQQSRVATAKSRAIAVHAYKTQKDALRKMFYSRNRAIHRIKKTPRRRKSSYDALNASRTIAYGKLRTTYKKEMSQLPVVSWLTYLQHEAQRGNDEALQALRRHQKKSAEHNSRIRASSPASFRETVSRSLRAGKINKRGEVRYYAQDGGIIIDGPGQVAVLVESEQAIAAMVALAAARYEGRTLEIDGSQQFKERAALLAGEKESVLSFADHRLESTRRNATQSKEDRGELGD